MSELALSDPRSAAAAGAATVRVSIPAIAWRNLWRNRRRTWLMVAGIGFAGFLVVAINSIQVGTFTVMIDNTARFFAGHAQVQHPEFLDEPRVEHTVDDAAARLQALERLPQVTGAAPRAQSFALVAAAASRADPDAEPPAVGALVVGVDPQREFAAIRHAASSGRYLEARDEAYLGAVLAQNLGVGTGDEVVVVGNAEGGVAAMSVTVVGTFSTGQAEFDRSQMHVRLDAFQEAFALGDAVHGIAVTLADPAAAIDVAASLGDESSVGVPWQQLMPEVHQMAELKYQSSYMIYALLLVLVTFSIVNAFIMTTFERTPEFGMLKALGMRPGAIMAMLALEALWMALLGLAATLAASGLLLGTLANTGIPLTADMAGIMSQYLLPDRLYPVFGYRTAVEFGVAALLATQAAALIPALRLRRLKVVDALRMAE